MFSLLHITDLHRSKTDPLSNAELLSALLVDRDRYTRENPSIRSPDAIIVSGDLIQGVGLGSAGFEDELAAQYEVAHEFLADLCDRFLDGDRSRVVIVPGNHDIDWNIAFSAMELVAAEEMPKNLPAALYEPESLYRWDWKSRQLYVIKDKALYRNRLRAFWTFFENFYLETSNLLKVAPWSDANIYSLDEDRIGIAAFNSCAGNDCFAFQGEIPREAIAKSYLDLKDLGAWRLKIAVWHHDVEGPPNRADYMDVDIVRGMIGRGFRIGLYGHQHRLQITPHQARRLDGETMAVASAGSLCAGRWELPTGSLRGYSIIEIQDDYAHARVHVREMGVANLFTRAVLADFQGSSYVDLDWTAPVDASGRPEDPAGNDFTAVIQEAEGALRARNDPSEAIRLLLTIDLSNEPYGRRLLIDAAGQTGDPSDLPRLIGEPQTIDELVRLIEAHIATGHQDKGYEAIRNHAQRLQLPQAIQTDLETRIKLIDWSKA